MSKSGSLVERVVRQVGEDQDSQIRWHLAAQDQVIRRWQHRQSDTPAKPDGR